MTALIVTWALGMSVVVGYLIGHVGHGLLTAVRRHRAARRNKCSTSRAVPDRPAPALNALLTGDDRHVM